MNCMEKSCCCWFVEAEEEEECSLVLVYSSKWAIAEVVKVIITVLMGVYSVDAMAGRRAGFKYPCRVV